jgi:hypothetical protein
LASNEYESHEGSHHHFGVISTKARSSIGQYTLENRSFLCGPAIAITCVKSSVRKR